MNRFDDMNANIDWFKLRTKQGYISTSLLRHYDIYVTYDYYRERNNPVELSVILTSENLNICRTTIYGIIKKMEEEII